MSDRAGADFAPTSTRWQPSAEMAWHLLVVAAILVLPGYARLGIPLWRLPAPDQTQAWIWGVAYLAWVLMTGFADRRGRGAGRTALSMLGGGFISFGLGWCFLRAAPDLHFSRLVALGSLIIGLVGMASPALLRPRWGVGLFPLLVAGFVIPGTLWVRPTGSSPATSRVVHTALYDLTLVAHQSPELAGVRPGGALVAWQGDYLLVTAEGELFRIATPTLGQQPVVESLGLQVPINLAAYLEYPLGTSQREPLRVTSLLVEQDAEQHRVVVAHQYWDSTRGCFTMRVSIAPLPDPGARATDTSWTTVFESQPCVPHAPPINAQETGGRLAPIGFGNWLLSLGNWGHDGLTGPAYSQDSTSDYGKVWRLTASGGRQLLTKGHRNPQGLVVARDGTIWSTEHGPRGGDELNRLVEGANYGWPLATYGTQYGQWSWPLAPPAGDHSGFTEPALAFVPSIAPSSLIEVTGGAFPSWEGDLLVGALAGQALYRIRTRQGRALFAEPIPIGQRVRSMALGRDGTLLLWTDRNALVQVRPVRQTPVDSALASCRGCHGAELAGSAFGPSLIGVVNRPVSADSGYPYSAALRAFGGRWTETRLDAFLRDPGAMVPGTAMRFGGLAEPSVRAEILSMLGRLTAASR